MFFVKMNRPKTSSYILKCSSRTEEKVPHPLPDLCISTKNMQSIPVGFISSRTFPQQKDGSTSLELQEGDNGEGGCERVTGTVGGEVGVLTSRRT